MKHRLAWVVSAVLGGALCAAHADEVAIVKKDRVNVRGQANAKSEVITQLHKGEAVNVLEEIAVKNPRKGDPAAWARIQLPANTPVWVYAPYVEAAGKTVNIKRVNIRSGPGENFSIIGRLERGTTVKEIRTVEHWMEIESPTNTFAFVAADLLEKAPPATPEPKPAETAKPEPTPVLTPDTNAVPATAAAGVPTPVTPLTEPASTNLPEPAVVPAPEPPPRRMVSREGIVIVSRSIQAPTDYSLESQESRHTINYLHSEDPALKFKNFGGRKVIVSGEELLDSRWANTPIIEVETIRLVP